MVEYTNYKRNLITSKDENFFLLPWACILIKNCDDVGELLNFKTKQEYKDQTRSMWLLLKLHLFRDNVSIF